MKNRGFTIVEIFVVVGIFVILTTAALPLYANLQVSTQLNETASQIIQAVRYAQGLSRAGKNNSRHGIYFNVDNLGNNFYVIYQGNNFFDRNTAYDRTTNLDDVLSIQGSGFNKIGDSFDVNFSQGLSRPNNTGTIILVHGVQGSRNIEINNFGRVTEN